MNNVEKILDVIGLKVGEKFKFKHSNSLILSDEVYFDENLILRFTINECVSGAISKVLSGNVKITKLPQLTDNDKEILEFYSKRGYKWFIEDANEEQWAFKNKPFKNDDMKFWNTDSEEIDSNELIDKLSFISWNDADPYYYEG